MNLSPEIQNKYYVAEKDLDADIFWELFDQAAPLDILEVGCMESYVSNILAELGNRVTGVDLRNYGAGHAHIEGGHGPNYTFMRKDINTSLCAVFLPEIFDVAVSLSAIEHFGLGTYSEGPVNHFYDVIAMHNIWRLLRPGGLAYISVPYGRAFCEWGMDWRVYDAQALEGRIVQDFKVEDKQFFVASGEAKGFIPRSGSGPQMSISYGKGTRLTQEQADEIDVYPPHGTVLLKLRKVPVARVAPDGR